ncbi:DNA mismatch repair protein MutS [Flavobacteriaceae bacterium AU392]|nr:DNA mismatch repair protein MutS [Flavobacteriaceae bacterium]RKM85789.1 DNA mismatch repair protein MutS [Flavobacteriaceae bacterium AU392]
MLKKGDIVTVLDENFSGTIIKIIDDKVVIETDDGFELEFFKKELIKTDNSIALKSKAFSKSSIEDVISEKEIKKHKSIKVKAKERNLPAMEVDLHIHQLTKFSKRMSNHEMLTLQLNTAKHQLEFAIKKRIKKVVFIHGVGEGVLKLELEYLFKRYDNIKYYDANYQKYGLGATEIYIYQN